MDFLPRLLAGFAATGTGNPDNSYRVLAMRRKARPGFDPGPIIAAILPWCWRRHGRHQAYFLYFVHIFNQIELGLERLNDSAVRKYP